jgi:hypothetical protein
VHNAHNDNGVIRLSFTRQKTPLCLNVLQNFLPTIQSFLSHPVLNIALLVALLCSLPVTCVYDIRKNSVHVTSLLCAHSLYMHINCSPDSEAFASRVPMMAIIETWLKELIVSFTAKVMLS